MKKQVKTQEKTVEKVEEKQKPVAKFKSGAIQGTIWSKEIDTEHGKKELYSFNLQRSYKDKEDKWQHTSSFRKQDTANVNAVMNRITDFLYIDEDENEEEEIY